MKSSHVLLSSLASVFILLAACTPSQRPIPGANTHSTTNPAPTSLLVEMEGGKSLRLSLADIAKLPHEKVRATERDGTTAEYSGVPLGKILAAVDAPLGDSLRGPNLALYIVAQGADHYEATYSIVEADPAFGDRHILIADQRDGHPLATRAAPLQVIVPDDKMQARWVRSLIALYVRRAP